MSTFKDLTGSKFGKLTVTNIVPARKNGKIQYLCQCECGNTKIVYGEFLRNAETKSCGCISSQIKSDYFEAKRQLEVGKMYNRCEVLKAWSHNKFKTKVELKCFCTNIFTCDLDRIKIGDTKSCGCLSKLAEGRAALNDLYKSYKESATKRNIYFQLTLIEFQYFTRQNCYYCGCVPFQIRKQKSFNGHYIYNGIDRVDNSKGYTLDNCVACCKKHNSDKGSMSVDQMVKALQFLGYKCVIKAISE